MSQPSLIKRLLVALYDGLLILATLFLATALTMPFTKGEVSAENRIYMSIYLLTVIYVFLGWFWTHGGQTLGMRAWKIRVELDNGQNLNWGQAFLRFILAILTFGVGLLWCLWDKKYRAFYDLLAKTQVVMVEKRYVPTI